MKQPQTISATEARNNFFDLLNRIYYGKKSVVVKRNKVPLVAILPFSEWVKKTIKSQMGILSSKDALFKLVGIGESKTKKGFSSDKYKLYPRMKS